MSAPRALASETGSLTWTNNSIPDLSGKTFIVTGNQRQQLGAAESTVSTA